MARKSTPKNVEPATVAEVREWAIAEGLTVAMRGRLSATVKTAFTEKTGRPIVAAV
jgi:hypothetical protein